MDDGTFKPVEEFSSILDALEAANDDLLKGYTPGEIDLSPAVIEEWERKNKNKDKEAEEWLRRQKEWYRQDETAEYYGELTDAELRKCDGWWRDHDPICLTGWID